MLQSQLPLLISWHGTHDAVILRIFVPYLIYNSMRAWIQVNALSVCLQSWILWTRVQMLLMWALLPLIVVLLSFSCLQFTILIKRNLTWAARTFLTKATWDFLGVLLMMISCICFGLPMRGSWQKCSYLACHSMLSGSCCDWGEHHGVLYGDPDIGTSGGMLWDDKIVAIILWREQEIQLIFIMCTWLHLLQQVLEGRAYRLQHPWVGVVNRSQQDINKNVDMIAARRRERDYFQQSSDYGHLTSRMGSEYLGKVLSKV